MLLVNENYRSIKLYTLKISNISKLIAKKLKNLAKRLHNKQYMAKNLISGQRIWSLFLDNSAIFLGYTGKVVFRNGPEQS